MIEAIIHDPEDTIVAVPALVARRLLLATVTILFIFGWLGLWLVHVGTFGAAIFAASDIVVFASALIVCVRTLNQLDARDGEAAAANVALKEKQQCLEVLLDNLNVGIIASDAEGRATLLNRTIRQYNNLPTEGPVPDTSIEDRPARYGLYYAGGTELMRPEDTPTHRAL